MKSFKNYFFFFLCLGLCLSLLPGLAILTSTSEQKVDPEELEAIGVSAIILSLFSGFYFGSVFWSISDANKRGKPGCLVGLMIAVWPIIGLILWLVFRPS